jgi:hypothetical protein
MHRLSYSKSRCLTDTSSRFGSRRRHIHGAPSQLLAFQHVKWFPATVRPRIMEMRPSLTIRYFWSFLAVALTITVLRYWNIKLLKASLMEPRINKTHWIFSWLPYVHVLFVLVALKAKLCFASFCCHDGFIKVCELHLTGLCTVQRLRPLINDTPLIRHRLIFCGEQIAVMRIPELGFENGSLYIEANSTEISCAKVTELVLWPVLPKTCCTERQSLLSFYP